jgi:hypothetical protein
MILKLLNGKSAEEDPGLDEDREAAESHHAADRTLHDVTQSQPGSEFLDLKKVLCSRGGACKYRDGATALYSDNTHLSARGGLMALEGWRIEEADVEAPLRPSSYQ